MIVRVKLSEPKNKSLTKRDFCFLALRESLLIEFSLSNIQISLNRLCANLKNGGEISLNLKTLLDVGLIP